MVSALLDAEKAQTLLYILEYAAMIFVPILIIYLTLKIKYLSHIIGIIVAIGISVGYAFRDKLFPFIFNIQSYEELEGFQELKFLWIFLSLGTFIWIVYTNSAGALKEDDEGWYILVWSTDYGGKKWTIFGRMVFIGAIASAILGVGVAWLTCNIWNGCVYIFSVIQVIIGIVCLIGSRY